MMGVAESLLSAGVVVESFVVNRLTLLHERRRVRKENQQRGLDRLHSALRTYHQMCQIPEGDARREGLEIIVRSELRAASDLGLPSKEDWRDLVARSEHMGFTELAEDACLNWLRSLEPKNPDSNETIQCLAEIALKYGGRARIEDKLAKKGFPQRWRKAFDLFCDTLAPSSAVSSGQLLDITAEVP